MSKHKFKLTLGVLLGLLFVWLALRNVDVDDMLAAFRMADYRYTLLAAAVLMTGHFLRAVRWRFFLAPIKTVPPPGLFSALVIGYAANSFAPAHLGEFLRAFVLGKKHRIPMSAAFATIVVERVIDIFSLIAVMLMVIFMHPFPQWVVKSGGIMLGGAAGLLAALVLLKVFDARALAVTGRLLFFLPDTWRRKLLALLDQFISGLVPLKHALHYPIVLLLSAAIWGCYAMTYHYCLEAFGFAAAHQLPWYVSLVVLVITTISIVVPSSPGYVGTYHFLCQVSLQMFGISAGAALSFAAVAHAVNILPVTILGLVLANFESVSLTRQAQMEEVPAPSLSPTQ